MTDLTGTGPRYFVADAGLDGPTVFYGHPEYADWSRVVSECEFHAVNKLVWPLAVAVLTETDEAVEAVARATYATIGSAPWEQVPDYIRGHHRTYARAALSALRDLAGGAS